ncbi:hypothetical protein [Streptomyces sp. NPDC096153]|uniref:hypothetical protein n=1 Tax=Streptomyces sp. NPDC096153 TaxID=3155548 RepID=UPI003331E6DC
MDADFLAIYGIDLEEDDITARRYFSLAHRLPAFQGVLAARVEAEREASEPSTSDASSSRSSTTSSAPAQQYQSVEALAARHPGEIELVKLED